MHLVFFLIVLAALVTGLQFVAETYAGYQTHLVVATALYFVVWFLASRSIREPMAAAKPFGHSESESTSPVGYLRKFSGLTFLEAVSVYVAGLSLLLAGALLLAGHSFRGLIVGSCGFGIAMVMANLSARSAK